MGALYRHKWLGKHIAHARKTHIKKLIAYKKGEFIGQTCVTSLKKSVHYPTL